MTPRPIAADLDWLTIPDFVLSDLIGGFTGVALALMEGIPSPDMKWVDPGNFEYTAGNSRERGHFVSMLGRD